MARRKRISISDLGEARALPLSPPHVTKLAGTWGTKGSYPWDDAWADIDTLARQFLACNRDDDAAYASAWHHLLMAIGNFKRSAGHIAPLSKPLASVELADRRARFTIPGLPSDQAEVACEDPATWSLLTKGLKGLGVPTATTLLSALWPERHAILDIRDATAAVGIGADPFWDRDNLNDAKLPERDWLLYRGWFRDTIVRTATADTCEPVRVERALFGLDERTKKRLTGRNWTWSDYRVDALDVLAELDLDAGDE